MRADTATEPAGPAPDATQCLVALALRNARTAGSLQLVLSRLPRPEEEQIADVIASGVFAFELLIVPYLTGTYLQAEACLVWQGVAVGGKFAASGLEPRVALSNVLSRQAALAAGEAISGNFSELAVEVKTVDIRRGDEAVQRIALHELFRARRIQSSFEIQIVAPGPDGLAPVPRRVEASRRGSRLAEDRSPKLAKLGTELVAVGAMADPRAEKRLRVGPQPDVDPIPDLDDEGLAGSDVSYPVVDLLGAPSFPDTIEAKRRWYCPAFEIALPAPGDAFATSPFQFVMKRPGITTLRLELVPRLPEALAATPGVELKAIEPTSISVAIEVPFVDERTGRSTTDSFECAVTRQAGRWIVTCDLANDWGRVFYRALSSRDPQDPSVQVRARISFRGVTRTDGKILLAAGGKAATLPVKREPGRLDTPHVDAAARTVNAGSVALYMPLERGLVTASPGVNVRPPILHGTEIAALQGRKLTLARTVACTRSAPLRAPCDQYGAFYIERKDIGDVAIGCNAALALGSIPFNAYEEITQLATATYRVFRSLQRPGRALVLPARMRVSRHAPRIASRAYRPALVVYCTLDPGAPGGARVLVDATFEPDIAIFERRRLTAALRAYMADPILEYPSAVTTADAFHWAVDRNATVLVEAFPFDAHLVHASFETDVAGALLVRSMIEHGGILGTWELALPDGQKLRTTLVLDLEAFAGPWDDGPMEVARNGASIQLANRVETPIEVTGVLVERGTVIEEVPANLRIGPGDKVSVPVSGAFERATPIYRSLSIEGVALEEVRSFIEDVRINVVFVDQLDHVARGISQIEVTARIVGVEPTRIALFGEDGIAELEFLLPLTTYLDGRVVEFAITITPLTGAVTRSPWHRQDLTTGGNVVGLTPNLLS